MSAGLDPTTTPFSFDLLSAMSLGDPRAYAMTYGPWELRFDDDTVCLDDVPVCLHSWEHALELAGDRPDALRWLAILGEDARERSAIRAAGNS